MQIKYNTDGLVPAIIQDAKTKNVLMLGYMNEEAFLKTNELKKLLFTVEAKNGCGRKGRRAAIFLNW